MFLLTGGQMSDSYDNDPFRNARGPAFDGDPFASRPGDPFGAPASGPPAADPFAAPPPPVQPQGFVPETSGRSDRRGGGGRAAVWVPAIATVLAAVIGGIALWMNRDDDKDLAADIVEAQMSVINPCCEWSVQVDVKGFKGRSCTVEAEVFLPNGEKVERAVVQEVTMDEDRDRANIPVSIPLPPGWYQVHFVVRGDNGLVLDRFGTPTVEVTPV